jgi:lysophospholipase D
VKTQRNKIILLESLFEEFPDMPMNIDLKTPTEPAIAEFDRLVRKFKRQHLTIWGAINS